MGGVSKSVLMRAARNDVYGIITNVARYPEFLPEIHGVTIGRRSPKGMDVTFRGQIIAPIEYTLRFTLEPPERVSWIMVSGQVMRFNTGGWDLVAKAEALTEATYTIDIGFGPLVPKIVTTTLVSTTLPATLQRFKERAETWARRTPRKRRRIAG